MKEKRLKFKVLRGHSRGCYAIKNFRARAWSTPWAYVQREADYRDSLGRLRKTGGVRWLRIGCNCTECVALIAVNETSFLEMLAHG